MDNEKKFLLGTGQPSGVTNDRGMPASGKSAAGSEGVLDIF